jgi:hypothetical protein
VGDDPANIAAFARWTGKIALFIFSKAELQGKAKLATLALEIVHGHDLPPTG